MINQQKAQKAKVRSRDPMLRKLGVVTTAEAAEFLGRSYAYVMTNIHRGWIPTIRLLGAHVIREKDVEQFTPRPRGNPAYATHERAATDRHGSNTDGS